MIHNPTVGTMETEVTLDPTVGTLETEVTSNPTVGTMETVQSETLILTSKCSFQYNSQ